MSTNQFRFDRKVFSHTGKVDLVSTSPSDNLEHIAAIAEEHNFRGIVVPLYRVPELDKIREGSEGAEYKIIAAADFPYGTSPEYVRKHMCIYASECGAEEIEICCPYALVKNKDISGINRDLKTIIATSKKLEIVPRIAIDTGPHFFSDDVSKTRLFKVLHANKIENIMFYNSNTPNGEVNHSTNIIEMRELKLGRYSVMKAQLTDVDLDVLCMYPKAGAKLLGLNWRKASNLVHGYENIIQAQMDNDSSES